MFKKNLEYVSNEELKQRLMQMTIEESRSNMSYCMTTSNDYLLLKHDVPLDDINNPRKAIQDMLKESIKKTMVKNDIIITFGIGLCYLLDEVFNTYPSKIFIYEPDTQLLHFVLNNVDISEHLQSGRVFIYDNLDDLLKKLSEIYITKDNIEVVYLKNYAVVKSKELLSLTQRVYETCKSKTIDINTITRYSQYWLMNTIKNIKAINENSIYNLSDLNDKFIGETALLVAPGPSLAENIQYIKDNRNKFVIFAVNKVLQVLLDNNITPDFVVCVDPRFVLKTLVATDEQLEKINCIMNLNSDSDILTKKFKRTFVSFPQSDSVVKKISEYNSFMKLQENGGSATTAAFVSAVKMGFSKIITVGVDLAIKGETVYANGGKFEKVNTNQIKINSITKTITTVPSVTGLDVLTTDDYAAFINHFATLIKDLDYKEIYNTTSFGALIPGMKNAKLDSIMLLAISNTTSIKLGEAGIVKIDTAQWTQDELAAINHIIEFLSKNMFSPALVTAVVKSSLMYQYMQAEVLKTLQSNFDDSCAEDFIAETKNSIKCVIELLQQNNLI